MGLLVEISRLFLMTARMHSGGCIENSGIPGEITPVRARILSEASLSIRFFASFTIRGAGGNLGPESLTG